MAFSALWTALAFATAALVLAGGCDNNASNVSPPARTKASLPHHAPADPTHHRGQDVHSGIDDIAESEEKTKADYRGGGYIRGDEERKFKIEQLKSEIKMYRDEAVKMRSDLDKLPPTFAERESLEQAMNAFWDAAYFGRTHKLLQMSEQATSEEEKTILYWAQITSPKYYALQEELAQLEGPAEFH